MKINCGLTEAQRKKVADEMQHYLADSYAVYLKTQNFHWNIKSPHFFSLHLLLEKQYEELAETLDEIAERIQALGFYAEASFSAFQKCCIKDANKPISDKKMIEQLIVDHEALIRCGRQLGTTADDIKDHATVDMVGRQLGAHEKMAWMLRSHLQLFDK